MALSERDRRLLEQLESSLHEDDPELDAKMTPTERPPWTVQRLRGAGAMVSMGLLIMVCGVGFGNLWVGVLGFLAMLGGAIYIAPSHSRGPVDRVRPEREHCGDEQ